MRSGLLSRSLSSLSARLRRTPGYAVLMYHRIADERRDPWDLCVTPQNFRAQIEWMRGQGFRFSTVAELSARIARGRDLRQRIAISFDDGYADNYLAAYPILAELDVPGTFFIASHYIESGEPFWWDAVEQFFLDPAPLPDRLEVQTSGPPLQLDLRTQVQGLDTFAQWRWEQSPPTPRHAALVETWHHLFEMPPAARDHAIRSLYAAAGRVYGRTAVPTRRAMMQQELRSLAADGKIEIGAHTMHHPNLVALEPQAQAAEIAGSKVALEAMTGREISGFAYPNGCYNSETLREVERAGFSYACSNCASPMTPKRYELPRFAVANSYAGRLPPEIHWHAGLSLREQ